MRINIPMRDGDKEFVEAVISDSHREKFFRRATAIRAMLKLGLTLSGVALAKLSSELLPKQQSADLLDILVIIWMLVDLILLVYVDTQIKFLKAIQALEKQQTETL